MSTLLLQSRSLSLSRFAAVACLAASSAFVAPAALAGGHGHATQIKAPAPSKADVAQLQQQLAEMTRRIATLEKSRAAVATVAAGN